jgi:hypothetical protein
VAPGWGAGNGCSEPPFLIQQDLQREIPRIYRRELVDVIFNQPDCRANVSFGCTNSWGFTTRGFVRSMALLAPVMLLTTVGFVAYGKHAGSMILNWHILLICLPYPFWGLVQQVLIVALLAGNMSFLLGGTGQGPRRRVGGHSIQET